MRPKAFQSILVSIGYCRLLVLIIIIIVLLLVAFFYLRKIDCVYSRAGSTRHGFTNYVTVNSCVMAFKFLTANCHNADNRALLEVSVFVKCLL